MNCPVARSEQEYDRRQHLLTIISAAQAPRDWALVQEKAALFLSGKSFQTIRPSLTRENGQYVTKPMPLKFDMGDVSIAVFETEGFSALLADHVNGNAGAADAIADLARMKACEVAFYALDLDERWDDLQHLIAEAIKCSSKNAKKCS